MVKHYFLQLCVPSGAVADIQENDMLYTSVHLYIAEAPMWEPHSQHLQKWSYLEML